MNDQPALVRAPAQPIETDISMADGIFAKSILVRDMFTTLPQHSHRWDHTSLIAAGAVTVYENLSDPDQARMVGLFRAPASLVIKAGVQHTFVTYEPDTVIVCIHRIDRTGEIDIEAEHQIV